MLYHFTINKFIKPTEVWVLDANSLKYSAFYIAGKEL